MIDVVDFAFVVVVVVVDVVAIAETGVVVAGVAGIDVVDFAFVVGVAAVAVADDGAGVAVVDVVVVESSHQLP